MADAMLSESFADYESGGYSPAYTSQSHLDPGTFVINEEDDLQRLEFARIQVQGTGSRVEASKICLICYHQRQFVATACLADSEEDGERWSTGLRHCSAL